MKRLFSLTILILLLAACGGPARLVVVSVDSTDSGTQNPITITTTGVVTGWSGNQKLTAFIRNDGAQAGNGVVELSITGYSWTNTARHCQVLIPLAKPGQTVQASCIIQDDIREFTDTFTLHADIK